MLKKNGYILLIVICLTPVAVSAQFEDTIRVSLEKKPAFLFKLDSRHTFITKTVVKTLGFKAGLEYNNRLSLGLGYNTLFSDVNRQATYPNDPFGPDTIDYKLKYFYFSPFVEYVFYRDDKWELSIPVQIGIGQSKLKSERYHGDKTIKGKSFMLSYEPAITAEYRIIRWMGFGIGAGYRLMLYGNNKLNEQFTAPVYIFKLKIFFKEFIR